jgi:hypothetical protein
LRRWSRANWFPSTLVQGKNEHIHILVILMREESDVKVVSSEFLGVRKDFCRRIVEMAVRLLTALWLFRRSFWGCVKISVDGLLRWQLGY